jgi:hypothetical protein
MQCLFSPPFTLFGHLCSFLSLSIYFTTMQLAVAVEGGDLFLFRLASAVPRNTTAARSSSGRFDGRRGKSTPSTSSTSAASFAAPVSAPLLIPTASTGFGRPSRALACDVEHLHWADGGALIPITQSLPVSARSACPHVWHIFSSHCAGNALFVAGSAHMFAFSVGADADIQPYTRPSASTPTTAPAANAKPLAAKAASAAKPKPKPAPAAALSGLAFNAPKKKRFAFMGAESEDAAADEETNGAHNASCLGLLLFLV